MGCSLSSPTADARLSFHWLALGERSADLVAMRCAIYGGELAWVGEGDATFAWDAYDRVSTALLVRDGARLVASGRLTVEQDGPLEVSDLVDWKGALPPGAPCSASRGVVARDDRSVRGAAVGSSAACTRRRAKRQSGEAPGSSPARPSLSFARTTSGSASPISICPSAPRSSTHRLCTSRRIR